MTAATANNVKRFTGLLIIEVVNSNPNGDPDRESDVAPRCCTALAESEIRLWWWPRYVRA